MRERTSPIFGGNMRQLPCLYHGAHGLHLEARVFEEKGDDLLIGVGHLFKSDVTESRYDPERHSLDLWYQHYGGARIAIISAVQFTVPKEIKEVNVYDALEKVVQENSEGYLPEFPPD